MTHELFLSELYDLEVEQDSDIDKIFNYIDDLLCNGDFTEVDNLLHMVNLEKLKVDLILSFLTITYAAKNKLMSRADFYKKAKRRMEQLTTNADEILDNLE